MNKEELLDNINEQQKAFCELYMTGQTTIAGKKVICDKKYNGTAAYCVAYERDSKDIIQERAARASASKLLAIANIKSYIKYLKEESGFNDEYIDAVGMKWLRSPDAQTSLKAMVEINKVRGRLASEDKSINIPVTNVGSGVVHVHIPK